MKPKRILIVEDEGIVALQIRTSLELRGYQVPAVCASGEAALEDVERLKPDLILMDMKLQGRLDGIETADRIRERHRIPIVYLTAHSETATTERARITEPYGYILKPFNVHELNIVVEMALYKHERDMEKERLTQELRSALDQVKVLSGLLPICCHCKKIRDDKGYWNQIEIYIREHSEAEFTHSICPECQKEHYRKFLRE